MESLRTEYDTGAKKRKKRGGEAGFTLVELMVAIVVFGILCAAAAVSWSAFTRYQNLRADANALYKDVMVVKARALENGIQMQIRFVGNTYIVEADPTVADHGIAPRTVNLNKSIELNPVDGWANRIVVRPNNLRTFDAGSVVLTSNKDQFRINMDAAGVRPELQHKKTTQGDNEWKKR